MEHNLKEEDDNTTLPATKKHISWCIHYISVLKGSDEDELQLKLHIFWTLSIV
jgi:hypothetical protein